MDLFTLQVSEEGGLKTNTVYDTDIANFSSKKYTPLFIIYYIILFCLFQEQNYRPHDLGENPKYVILFSYIIK